MKITGAAIDTFIGYRVAKTHRMYYFCRSLYAKELYN